VICEIGVPSKILGAGFKAQRLVANLWTEFAACRSEALSTNGKELQNPLFSLVAATCEMAKT
jgi:hypothetical protein